MSIGPKAPKTDYKSLWSSYSGWLKEAKTTYGQSSASSRAKAAAAGIKGTAPTSVQEAQKSEFEKGLKELRKGAVAGELKGFARKYTAGSYMWETGGSKMEGEYPHRKQVRVPAEFGPDSPDYETHATKFRNIFGFEPKTWEVYMTKRFGLSESKMSARDSAFFNAQEASGKRALGATVTGSSTSSPWV